MELVELVAGLVAGLAEVVAQPVPGVADVVLDLMAIELPDGFLGVGLGVAQGVLGVNCVHCWNLRLLLASLWLHATLAS